MATKAIQKIREELGDQPKDANRLIHLLNSKNRHELHELGVEDRTEEILKIKKVLSKRNLMLNLEEKCHKMQVGIDMFMTKFQILRDKALPNPVVIHDKLTTQLDYTDRLMKLAKEKSISSGIKSLPIGKVLYDTFELLFLLDHEVKYLFFTKTNSSKYA